MEEETLFEDKPSFAGRCVAANAAPNGVNLKRIYFLFVRDAPASRDHGIHVPAACPSHEDTGNTP
jgi:hypothetical protein